jgi:enoyl-CoA hydratase/3-hydroxyacyl-CoA dehydrogenase
MEKAIHWEGVEVLIVGSGLMGASLAQAFAQNGVNVGLIGRREESVERAKDFINHELHEAWEKGIFSKPQTEDINQRILAGLDLKEACRGKNLQLVIESATEETAVKKEIFQRLDEFCSPHVVLASNTSCLDAENLAAHTKRPEKFVWMHFFFPAHKNHAGEYALLAQSSPKSLDTAAQYFKRTGKDAVQLIRYRKGGAANVIFVALLLEAGHMLDENFSTRSIDEAGKAAFTMPAGFIQLMETVGLGLAASCIKSFSDTTEPGHPFHRVYDTFFSPPEIFRQPLAESQKRGEHFLSGQIHSSDEASTSLDLMVIEHLQRRFLAVAFMTAAEVVEAGVIKLDDVDRLCQNAFAWPEGPFRLMNKVGIREALIMVTEKMELSHRREINFPIPRLLIEQAQKDEPWPLAQSFS